MKALISMRLFLLYVNSVLCLTRRERRLISNLWASETLIKWSVWDTEATIIQIGVHGNQSAKSPVKARKTDWSHSLITTFSVATSPAPPEVGFNHYKDIYFLGFFLVNDFFFLEHLLCAYERVGTVSPGLCRCWYWGGIAKDDNVRGRAGIWTQLYKSSETLLFHGCPLPG